jgi:hypothetical protein
MAVLLFRLRPKGTKDGPLKPAVFLPARTLRGEVACQSYELPPVQFNLPTLHRMRQAVSGRTGPGATTGQRALYAGLLLEKYAGVPKSAPGRDPGTDFIDAGSQRMAGRGNQARGSVRNSQSQPETARQPGVVI